jgi:hypothetical protein
LNPKRKPVGFQHQHRPAAATNWTNLTTGEQHQHHQHGVHSCAQTCDPRLNIEALHGQHQLLCTRRRHHRATATHERPLGIDGLTPVGYPYRAVHVALNTLLVNLNNAATVIPSKPSPYSFPVEPNPCSKPARHAPPPEGPQAPSTYSDHLVFQPLFSKRGRATARVFACNLQARVCAANFAFFPR